MKKTLIALAALGVVGTAAAEATVYGRVDVGFVSKSSTATVVSGMTGTPRIGFKGSEDLGGGLTAMFGVETGFNNTNVGANTAGEVKTNAALGAAAVKNYGSGPTRIGDRGAYLGVSGAFGTVKIGGSLLTPTFFATAATDAMGLPNYNPTESRMWGQAHENLRHKSAIQYDNNFAGVDVKVSYVPAGNNGADANQSKTDIAAIYKIEGLTLAIASHTDADRTTVAGVAYDMGVAKVTYNRATGTHTGTGLGVSAPMGAVTVGAALYEDADSQATIAHVGYALSKATGLNAYISSPKGGTAAVGVGLSHAF